MKVIAQQTCVIWFTRVTAAINYFISHNNNNITDTFDKRNASMHSVWYSLCLSGYTYSISAMVTPIGVKVCITSIIQTQSLPFRWRQLSLAPRGAHYKQKCVAFLSISAISSVMNATSRRVAVPRVICHATHDWWCVARRRRWLWLSDVWSDATTISYPPAVIDWYFVKHSPSLDASINFNSL